MIKSQYRRPFQRGFSLLELMAVTATVGILASIAMPSYQSYVYRAKATEIIVVMDKLHGMLANLQSEAGATVGRPIMLQSNFLTAKDPTAAAFSYCVRPACNAAEWKPLAGLTQAELQFKLLGVTLSANSGNDPFNSKAGQYKVSVNEDFQQTKNNPALHLAAQQTILAVHHIMKPHTYRDVISAGKFMSSVYLYMNMNGSRP